MSALPELAPEQAAKQLVAQHARDPEWLDAFADAFERRRSGQELARVLRVWNLSQSEAGRLFGVTRQAVAKWLRHGAPADRVEQKPALAAATSRSLRPPPTRRTSPASASSASSGNTR
jgi:phage terminase Nu1 subunit (DNA packaging protein)